MRVLFIYPALYKMTGLPAGLASICAVLKENGCGQYYRQMDMQRAIKQIEFQIKKYNPEFLYFSSVNFLAMGEEKFDVFVKGYRKFKLPFWIQTRPETITKRRLFELKNVGMNWFEHRSGTRQ